MCSHGDSARGRRRSNGRRGTCLICQRERESGRDYIDRRLRKAYGIGADDYEALLKAQSGVCALCQKMCSKYSRLSVDHDHRTGRVRGLLCAKCNLILGKINDSPEWAARTIKYLT